MKKLNSNISKYLNDIKKGKIRANKDIKKMVEHILNCFKTEDIYVDDNQLEQYIGLEKYFPYNLYEWQKCLIGLHLCTYWKETGQPRWSDLIVVGGRGMGKDGTIAFESVCVSSPYNGIEKYDVDICANNEEQAKRPVQDIIEAFEEAKNLKTINHFYYWTKEMVRSKKTKSVIKGRTNNPKGRDGMRSGMVVFNEVHQYQNYENITVFTTGLGKVAHPRRLYFTSQGDIRDGVLDDLIRQGEEVLYNGANDNGKLFFLYRLEDKKQVHDPSNWIMANPSIDNNLTLREEIKKEYQEWKDNPHHNASFMTKRMNIPDNATEHAVTDWENIEACNKEIIDLSGRECVVGIDYAKTTDMVSVNAHFKIGDNRYDINHSWLCLKSADIKRIKAPYHKWVEDGYLTLVDDVEIHTDHIINYILELQRKYQIKKVAIDEYRYMILSNALKDIGIDAHTSKNLKLVRPSDIMKISPIIDRCFANKYFHWNNNRLLMWATNNTKLVKHGRTFKSDDKDIGNFVYGKIEGRSRKTDPFMALVASMVIENELSSVALVDMPELPTFVL